MFKISTKGDYGLLTLTSIAEFQKQGRRYISLKEIAEAKNLSLPYLSQIVVRLKEAGLVDSKEGREGGYSLAKDAKDITLLEVIEALEGPVAPVRCCNDKKGVCGSEAQCGVKGTWKDAQAVLQNFLKSKTLADTLTH